MPISTIAPDLRAAVVSGLTTYFAGLADFSGTTAPEDRVEVRRTWAAGWQAAEKVYLGRSRATTPPAALRSGRNLRNESGEFDLNVYVNKPGTDGAAAEDRAFAIAAKCEDWLSLRKSNELGVTGLQSLTVTGWASDAGTETDGGSGAVVTLTVSWTARLSA